MAFVRLNEPPARAMVPASLTAGAAPRFAAEATMSVPVPPILTPPVNVLVPERVIVPPVPYARRRVRGTEPSSEMLPETTPDSVALPPREPLLAWTPARTILPGLVPVRRSWPNVSLSAPPYRKVVAALPEVKSVALGRTLMVAAEVPMPLADNLPEKPPATPLKPMFSVPVKAEKFGVPLKAVVPTPVPMFVTFTVPAPAKPPRVYVLVPVPGEAAPRVNVPPEATVTRLVPKAPTEAAVAEAPEAMLVAPVKVLAPLSVSAPPATVTVAVFVPVKRLPGSTSAPGPDLVRPVVMLPELGLRVRTPLAAETSIVPVVTFSGRVEAPVAPVKRRVPAFSVMPVVVPRPRELPTVSAIVLASRTPSLTMVAPV